MIVFASDGERKKRGAGLLTERNISSWYGRLGHRERVSRKRRYRLMHISCLSFPSGAYVPRMMDEITMAALSSVTQ